MSTTKVKDIQKEISMNPNKCSKLVARYKAANLDAQFFIDATDSNEDGGWSPLHEVLRCCRGKNVLDLVEYIVETHPRIVKHQDKDGNLPMHVLPQFSSVDNKRQIQLDQLDARRFLLAKYPEALITKNDRGETPLVKAILLEYNTLIEDMLIDDETLAKEPNEEGKLPLHYAMENWSISTVEMLLEVYPDGILSIMAFPPGGTEDRQQLLAAIGRAIPETFDVDPTCGASEDEGQWQLSSNLIHQFFSEAKLEEWGQDIIWRMMQSSYHRHRQAFPEKMTALTEQLESERKDNANLRAKNANLEKELIESKIRHERTRQQLKVARAIGETASTKLKQHDILAQEQEAKYLALAEKVQSLQEVRNFNAESRLMTKMDNDKWTAKELRAVLESLIQRLNYLIPEHTKLSTAHIAANYLAKDEDADKAQFVDMIEALNQELLEL